MTEKQQEQPEAPEEELKRLRLLLQESDNEISRLNQAIGWIVDAADAAYIEDSDNKYIHDIFNIAAKAAGITRRLPDEHGAFEL